MAYYVYILAGRKHGTLYIGVTGDLAQRIWEHKTKTLKGFTTRYGVDRLVWYDVYEDVNAAIQREKTMEHWPRDWKINLIERDNPDWFDLYDTLNR